MPHDFTSHFLNLAQYEMELMRAHDADNGTADDLAAWDLEIAEIKRLHASYLAGVATANDMAAIAERLSDFRDGCYDNLRCIDKCIRKLRLERAA